MTLTARDLLGDEVYRDWFKKVPRMPETLSSSMPWYVYVLHTKLFWVEDSEDPNTKHPAPKMVWSRVAKPDYRAAFQTFKFYYKDIGLHVHDVVICSRVVEFKPPVDPRRSKKKSLPWDPHIVFPEIDQSYRWCLHCRRPTRYLYYTSHHALPGRVVDSYRPRCEVCGIGARD